MYTKQRETSEQSQDDYQRIDIDMKNNILTYVNDILFNIVVLWLDISPTWSNASAVHLYPSGRRLNGTPCKSPPQQTLTYCHQHIVSLSTPFPVLKKKGNNRQGQVHKIRWVWWQFTPTIAHSMRGNLVDVYGGVTLLQTNSTPQFALALVFDESKANQHSIAYALPDLYASNPHSSSLHNTRIQLP